MIHGAHAIIFSTNADADRKFFRDVLKLRFADAGHGWLIFALPPAEVAFHPVDSGGGEAKHQLYLMCDDIKALVAGMQKQGVATSPLHEERWGVLTQVTLPSGGMLGVYQPHHASPHDPPRKKKATKKATKKAAPKKAAPKKATKRPR